MSEANAARALAKAIEHLNRLKLFDLNVQDCEMHLSWHSGSATGGYHELAAEISRIVSERWIALRDEAIRRAEEQVEIARAEMRAALGKI